MKFVFDLCQQYTNIQKEKNSLLRDVMYLEKIYNISRLEKHKNNSVKIMKEYITKIKYLTTQELYILDTIVTYKNTQLQSKL